MAAPMTPERFAAVLRAEGLTVVEIGNWKTHNRNHKGPWGPIHGSMLHHTVSRGELSTVELCRAGYSTLPGPLCQVVIGKSGKVYLISAGRSNHAGGGDPNVLQAVIDERYGDRPPVPRVGNTNGVDGNAHFYGAECENMGDGKDPWPAVQVESMVRFCTAVSREYDWTEKSAIAHEEWSSDKRDPSGPGYPGHPVMRARIKERLAHPPSWNTPTDQGPAMTAPFRSLLARHTDVALIKDVPHTIYWEDEYLDDANEHGAGGKTVVTGGTYSGLVNLTLDGMDENDTLEVFPIEEDAGGVQVGSGFSTDVPGRVGGIPVRATVPVMGSVGSRLATQVIARSEGVILRHAWLSLQHWN